MFITMLHLAHIDVCTRSGIHILSCIYSHYVRTYMCLSVGHTPCLPDLTAKRCAHISQNYTLCFKREMTPCWHAQSATIDSQ